MAKQGTRRVLALVAVSALAVAACGGSSDTASGTSTTPGTSGTAGTAGTAAGVELAGVCPDRVVIQTDWNPQAEHGGVYELVGDGYTVDADRKRVRGPLVAGGTDTGVDVEIRMGGPAIGFRPVGAYLYENTDIMLGFANTDGIVQRYAALPTLSVMAGLDINPQIIMWDPVTYPQVRTIADLKATGAKVRTFEGIAFMQYLVGSGVLDKAQVDGSYDGTPGVFVAQQGKIAQQGFASAEPYIYRNEVKNWGRDVAYQLIHDTGWQPYAQSLVIRSAERDTLAPCLKKLVPVIQQAQVDFLNNPARTDTLIVDLVKQYNTGWVYSQGVADYAVAQMRKLGIVGNGPDQTLGDHDEARVAEFIKKALPIYKQAGGKVKDDLEPSDIVTNEFIDPSIKL